ncbi:MAG: hypothetical protein ACJA2E_002115 [Arenicella sp.]|jgi:hypothetical protein
MAKLTKNMTHILYASGKLLDSADRRSAIEQIAVMTNKSMEKIEQCLLSGQRRRIKSSECLEKLKHLEKKFRAAGFDVYIDPQ